MHKSPVLVLDEHHFARFREEYNNLPYGVESLTHHGYEVVHSDWAWSDAVGAKAFRRVANRLDNALEMPVTSVASQLRPSRDVDLVLSIFEYQALSYERLRALTMARLPPQVVMSCWLAAWSLTSTGRRFRALKSLGQQAAALTVFSENQITLLAQAFDIATSKIHVVPYGVDTAYYTPAATRGGGYVAAAGNDVGRDWPTFLRACAALPNVSFHVASQHSFEQLDVPRNVDLLGGLTHEAYRRLLQDARCVVVPVHPMAYPSGQSVALESYAVGKPNVTVRSPAMRTYLVDGASIAYTPGDPDDLARGIQQFIGTPEDELQDIARLARTEVVERFSNDVMWRETAAVLDAVRGGSRGEVHPARS